MKKKFMKDKHSMMVLIGASAMSMIAGIVVGMIKEKMMSMDSCCIIDEL